MGISGNTRLTLAENQISTTIDDEEVILHLDSGTYFGLDGVGRRIWELLDSEPTVAELEATIQEEFDVERERVEADVRAFVSELESEGLINIVDNGRDGQ